ncbi:MAG: diaminopimelate epimerase [Halioglobus sp.]|jgi:diaminopimelate epimerase
MFAVLFSLILIFIIFYHMKILFTKYHGTGNDFVMIDDRSESFDEANVKLVEAICSRRFGVGADGLILLRNEQGYDFKMVYFNSNGRQSSMCGNGGRCLVHFASSLDVFKEKCKFLAIDGDHLGEVLENGTVKLKMGVVDNISRDGNDFVLDTGSPHYVQSVESVFDKNVKLDGAAIRYSDQYKSVGINVNFINLNDSILNVATYERGVEDETYSCGTGVTASALVAHQVYGSVSPVAINTKGGSLSVHFQKTDIGYSNIWLEGPVVKVFDGVWPQE